MDDTKQYWGELLKRTAFNLFVGSAEKAGRRYGLQPHKIKQYLSGIRDELREIDEEMKPSNNENVGEVLAEIKAYMNGDPPKLKKPAATLDGIMSIVQSNADRISAMESK